MARNLVNLKDVVKGYAARTVLEDVTLGVAAGDRIGVVGRNGDGKSTLLRLIAGAEAPDAGAVTREGGLHVALLGQGDDLDSSRTIREELVGGRADHEWQADAAYRSVLDGLLGGVAIARFPAGLDTRIEPLSGGERRRIALAKTLLDHPELLLLDEPTNHLDVEGVDWLARHLAARRGSMLVVTHDRWFLDAVCTLTWEVADTAVHQYEGGYAAYVLARAERARQAAAREERRQQLLRKELAWLRRGPPARTSKPKFRIEAANALIADEPEARDRAELLRFASSRLGDQGARRRGGDGRVRREGAAARRDLAARARRPRRGRRRQRVRQDVADEAARGWAGAVGGFRSRAARRCGSRSSRRTRPRSRAGLRALEAVEAIRGRARLGDGRELTAGMLCERFGFGGERGRTLVRDLSGGERRRLQLMRLLMSEPNVLLLDEPTNDLDIDTLTALEDLLDGWPGTLVVVSHDRYFVERVCDNVYALTGDGSIRHLPGGIEQYLALRRPDSSAGARGRAHRAQPGRRARGAQGGRAARARAREVARARGRRCTRRWRRARPTICACASCRTRSVRTPPSVTGWRRSGSKQRS